jgi:hypothetical protein
MLSYLLDNDRFSGREQGGLWRLCEVAGGMAEAKWIPASAGMTM